MEEADQEDQGSKSGYSFLATVIAAGILGYALDQFTPTAPWGLLGFMVIGIVYATYKAQKAMNPPEVSDAHKKDDKNT